MTICTILVEDSPVIRVTLIPALQELVDAEVFAIAETSNEALAAIDRYDGRWHLMVVDLFLKQGSGLEVLEACQNRQPYQHVLVLTNYPTNDIRQRCLKLGAEAVFDKSTELEPFFDRVLSYA